MQNENIHKREHYRAEFKEKVALEALSGVKTHVQIASEYGISPDLVERLEGSYGGDGRMAGILQ